jgi:hypothetical protein
MQSETVSFRMWMDGETRKKMMIYQKKEMKADSLLPIVNSVKKHVEDLSIRRSGSSKRDRIDHQRAFRACQEDEEEKIYLKTSVSHKSHSRLMVTFTKIALSRRIWIPYTSNAIEKD